MDRDGVALGTLVALDPVNRVIAYRDADGLIWPWEMLTDSIALPLSGVFYTTVDCTGTPYSLVPPVRGLVVFSEGQRAFFKVGEAIETVTPRTTASTSGCDSIVFGPDGPVPETLARLEPLGMPAPDAIPPFDIR